MARLMLSAGMFSAFAAATAVRSRGFFSGSPPLFAAMVISLIRRVKILPRLASSAPFLCLIVAHLEWPDITRPRKLDDYRMPLVPLRRRGKASASERHGRAGQMSIIALAQTRNYQQHTHSAVETGGLLVISKPKFKLVAALCAHPNRMFKRWTAQLYTTW